MMLSRFLDAYLVVMSSPLNCCSPTAKQAPVRDSEKSMGIEHQQPRLLPSPIFAPQERSSRGHEWVDRTRSFASLTSTKASFTVKRNLNAYNGSYARRPRIGRPTDFRHLDSAVRPRNNVGRFRPLELSIYTDAQLSPILPHLVDGLPAPMDFSPVLPFPPAVMRSDSVMSFTIPRKPVRSSSQAEYSTHTKSRPGSLSADELLAALEYQLPTLPLPARLRSMTEPPSYDRVKTALYEKYQLTQQLKDIEEIIEERKSIYFSSRPVSRASRPQSVYLETDEPMPFVTPLVIPFASATNAPRSSSSSFSSRAAPSPIEQRPRTAPSKTVHIPSRLKSFTEASATSAAPSSTYAVHLSRQYLSERPLPPPPLPLILQAAPPPLRKKKSFSSVSKWLFPSSSVHTREISLDSITNSPKPITSRQGFYQCVDFQPESRYSTDSVVSMMSTLQSTLDEPAVNSIWTPGSSPRSDLEKRPIRIREISLDEERNESVELERVRTFSVKEAWEMEPVLEARIIPGRNSVGVAF